MFSDTAQEDEIAKRLKKTQRTSFLKTKLALFSPATKNKTFSLQKNFLITLRPPPPHTHNY